MLSYIKLEVVVLCMKKQLSLWIEQMRRKDKSSDLQTFRLFAILAALTLVFIIVMAVVQFSPLNATPHEISTTTEAKISP